jgi:hypothetical protein
MKKQKLVKTQKLTKKYEFKSKKVTITLFKNDVGLDCIYIRRPNQSAPYIAFATNIYNNREIWAKYALDYIINYKNARKWLLSCFKCNYNYLIRIKTK